jgi:hypothetical protein
MGITSDSRGTATAVWAGRSTAASSLLLLLKELEFSDDFIRRVPVLGGLLDLLVTLIVGGSLKMMFILCKHTYWDIEVIIDVVENENLHFSIVFKS